jgi:2-polyprenyl-6-hydroxyphenyl methylase/3-demethylubiquinone-9 3-methyltransferase
MIFQKDFLSALVKQMPKAFLFAIIGAEYVLKLLPRGTHEYEKFIRPAELGTYARSAGLELVEMLGLTYNPITRRYRLTPGDVSVNYLMAFRKPTTAQG